MFYRFRLKAYRLKRKLLFPSSHDRLLFQLRFGLKKNLWINTSRVRFQIDTSSTTAKAHFFPAFQKGILYEQPVIQFIENHCSRDSVFFDIGCNVGFFTLLASRLGANTHSFDLDPEMVSEAINNFKINKLENATITTAAIWNEDGRLVGFSATKNNKTMNRVNPTAYGLVTVPTLTIDSYCRQMNVFPDIIKIDVEGGEYHVLLGARISIAFARCLLLEIHPDQLAIFEHTVQDVIEYVTAQGFDVYMLRDHRMSSEPMLESVKSTDTIKTNAMLICTRP